MLVKLQGLLRGQSELAKILHHAEVQALAGVNSHQGTVWIDKGGLEMSVGNHAGGPQVRTDRHDAAILPTPAHAFASEIGPHSHSQRPLETLLPLSERLGLPLDEPFLRDDLDKLVEAIRACNGDVLVAWEHTRLPLIATRLVGDGSGVPQIWPDDRFDLVWVFEPGSTGGSRRLRQVPQLLLAGDRAEPIA